MDIVKFYTYIEPANFRCTSIEKNKYQTTSRHWVEWHTSISLTTCAYCFDQDGHILSMNDPTVRWPPVHLHCHCRIYALTAFLSGTATEDGLDGVDFYLFTHHCLPENYLTQKEAELRGWDKFKGDLWDVLPGVIIGGGQYKNRDGKLPDAPWRIWYETDIDYHGGHRGSHRIVFSNDGLMFVTYDHYRTFSEVYWEANYDDLYD